MKNVDLRTMGSSVVELAHSDRLISAQPRLAASILVVEDDPEISQIEVAYLAREGFRCVDCADGHTAIDLHRALKPDLVLLDVRMPKIDGWEVLAEIRRRADTPVIMLFALDQDIDKLQALRIGADDYVVKPFNPVEVVARVRAVLRRISARQSGGLLRVGPVQISAEGHVASVVLGQTVVHLNLTLTEYRLLLFMAEAPTRVFSRSELVDACLPGGDALDRTVDSHISKIRRKLTEAGAPGMPSGIRGVGYRLASLP